MASTTHSGTTVPASTTSAAQDIPVRNTSNDTEPFPVEMSSLQAETAIPETLAEQDTHTSDSTTQIRNRAMRTDTTTAILSSQNPPSPPPPLPTSKPDLARIRSTAIGESHDSEPITKDLDETDTGPKLMITLLLLTGARHPFNLDSKYLTKRSVKVKEDDPFNLSVYKVKELILREWRDEWEMKPSSPSAIRLISFGKVLDDKAAVRGRSAQARMI